MDIDSSMLVLTSDITKDDVLAAWLTEANENIYFLDQKNENIVNLILKLNWTKKSEEILKKYRELVLNLVTAHNIYLRAVLKMIISHFTPVTDDQGLDINPYVHEMLESVIKLIPSAPSLLLPMLADSFPYMKKSVTLQTTYLRNMFHLVQYIPEYRSALLEVVVVRLIQIDVHCPRDVILEHEEPDEPDENISIFIMETDSPKDENRYPLANILDQLINEVFGYIKSCCFIKTETGVSTEKLNWEATKKVYRELLTVFDRVILPTHACAHIQFIMFYICSLRNLLCEGFVDYLWKKVQNPNVSPVIRQASVCYIGSFLARAKYVHIRMVQDCLIVMCTWINSYIDSQSGTSYTYADAVHHSTFYAVCQVVFYLVTFRHREMVYNKKGRHILQELNLERIVNCGLNPLRICLPVVVKNFASVARNYQIAYCYTIIERNMRLFLPATSDLSSTGLNSFASLETFFPFDPYLLKRSGEMIQPLYRVYEEHQEDSQPEVNMEEKDLVQSSSQVQSFLPDLLHHSTSPGYRQYECISPKFR